MRWRFAESDEERARRAAALDRIDRFWAELAPLIDGLPARPPEEVDEWMSERLAPIAPGSVGSCGLGARRAPPASS